MKQPRAREVLLSTLSIASQDVWAFMVRSAPRTGALTAAVVMLVFSSALAWAETKRPDSVPAIPVLQVDTPLPAPDWAVMQRHLIETMNRAGIEFYRAYTHADGTLRWKERYEGGMNSSDDAYEAFRGFSLHYILGGSKELDVLHRRVWEGITRQCTRYGQIYRDFDSNWDWMHHGEG